MNRDSVVRWLLEKLLGSFVISAFFVWGPMLGIRMEGYGIGTVYTIVTTISLIISIAVNILVPREFEIFSRFRTKIKRE